MQLKDIIIIVLLLVAIYCFYLNLMKTPSKSKCSKCPDCPVCPKGTHTLDYVFTSDNFPSNVHDNLFRGSNVYQGGYKLDKNVYSILLRQS
jgi:hypothetical protein